MRQLDRRTREIAADKPIAMRSFVDIEERNTSTSTTCSRRRAKDRARTRSLQKLGAYYGACMDEAAIEKAGIKPIAAAARARSRRSRTRSRCRPRSRAARRTARCRCSRFGPTQDFADATKVIAGIDQGGLGLPDRDYYLEGRRQVEGAAPGVRRATSPRCSSRPATSPTRPSRRPPTIIALETEIAKVSKDQRRAPRSEGHVQQDRSRRRREGDAADFDWDDVLEGRRACQASRTSRSTSPDFLAGVDALLDDDEARGVAQLPDVPRHRATRRRCSTKKLEDVHFKLAAGAHRRRPSSSRAGSAASTRPTARSAICSARRSSRDRFAGASKAAAEDQVQAICAAMNANLDALPWMDATTKQQAHDQARRDGLPRSAIPRSGARYDVQDRREDYAANALAARTAEHARQLAKIGKPVDRDDWHMTRADGQRVLRPAR